MPTKVEGDASQCEPKSEVACLMAQMAVEYEAARLGLSGLAQGTGRHSFISTRMENLGKLGGEIDKLGGEGLALAIEYIGKLAEVPKA